MKVFIFRLLNVLQRSHKVQPLMTNLLWHRVVFGEVLRLLGSGITW